MGIKEHLSRCSNKELPRIDEDPRTEASPASSRNGEIKATAEPDMLRPAGGGYPSRHPQHPPRVRIAPLSQRGSEFHQGYRVQASIALFPRFPKQKMRSQSPFFYISIRYS